MNKDPEQNKEQSTPYPGVAVDRADDDKVTEKLVEQMVKEENNNPASDN